MIPTAVACQSKKPSGPVETTDSGAENTNVTDSLYDQNGYLKDSLPADLDFNREFLIYAASTQAEHFYAEENDTGNLSQVIYKRNATVEERLGLFLTWKWQPCYEQADQKVFQETVQNDVMNEHLIDCVISYNLLPYTQASKGNCVNLATTKYIDLSAPWWPQVFLNHMLYRGQIFTLVNNSGRGTLCNMSAIFFNNTLINNYHIESPYDLVDNNEWTLEKLKELTRGTYLDLNHNNGVDTNDQFGICTSTDARLTCWYFGAGVKLIVRDEQDELQLKANDPRTGTAIDSIVNLFDSDDAWLVDGGGQHTMFSQKRAIFYLDVVQLAEALAYENIDIDFGVAPVPKLDSDQEEYYTHLPNTHDAWYIPTGVSDEDCSAAFIECMASEAYRQVEPVYYSSYLKIRYAPDERLAKMYDLIRSSITFDFNYLFRFVFSKDCDTWIRYCIRTPLSYSWASSWESIGETIEQDLQKIKDTYALRQ